MQRRDFDYLKVHRSSSGEITTGSDVIGSIPSFQEDSEDSTSSYLTYMKVKIVRYCKKCNKEFNVYRRLFKNGTMYVRKKEKQYCSRICANSHIQKQSAKDKISKKLKLVSSWKTYDHKKESLEQRAKRANAIKEAFARNNSGDKIRQKLLGKKHSLERRNKLSKALKGKTGGYRTKSGTSKFYGKYYKDIWMDSEWEVIFAKILDSKNIKWKREQTYFLYHDKDNNVHKYYPDFYLPDTKTYIEIKGYYTDKIRYKLNAVKKENEFNLIILDSLDKITNFV